MLFGGSSGFNMHCFSAPEVVSKAFFTSKHKSCLDCLGVTRQRSLTDRYLHVYAHGCWADFFQGRTNSGFFQVVAKNISRGATVVEFHFTKSKQENIKFYYSEPKPHYPPSDDQAYA